MIRPIQITDITPTTLQDWIASPVTEALRLSRAATAATWPSQSQSRPSTTFAMPVDVYSTHDQAVVVAALPGVHPDSIDVTVHRNVATIRASARTNQAPESSKEVTWYISELGRGAFERTITFPFAIDEQAVEAHFANGLLRLVLPRREKDRPQRIPVRVGGGQSPLSLSASANADDRDAPDGDGAPAAVAD